MSRSWLTLDDATDHLTWRVHQSALNEADICLERVRLGMLGDVVDGPSDATAVGTALHAGIECSIDSFLAGDGWLSVLDIIELGVETFVSETEQPGFRWVKRNEKQALAYLDKAARAWHEQVQPALRPVATEVPFGPYELFTDEVNRFTVEVAGTIDYVDAALGLMDWKTGSPHSWERKGWEKQRWAIQPTTYTWGYERLLQEQGKTNIAAPIPFTFVVMLDNGKVHTERVTRTPRDWLWLQDKVRSLAPLVMSELPVWPKNDQHALCSEKWCPQWFRCKGRDVEDTDDLTAIDEWRLGIS